MISNSIIYQWNISHFLKYYFLIPFYRTIDFSPPISPHPPPIAWGFNDNCAIGGVHAKSPLAQFIPPSVKEVTEKVNRKNIVWNLKDTQQKLQLYHFTYLYSHAPIFCTSTNVYIIKRSYFVYYLIDWLFDLKVSSNIITKPMQGYAASLDSTAGLPHFAAREIIKECTENEIKKEFKVLLRSFSIFPF